MKTQQQVIEQVTKKLNELTYRDNINYEIRVEKFKTNDHDYWVYIQTDQPWMLLTELIEIATRLGDETMSVAYKKNGIKLLATITV